MLSCKSCEGGEGKRLGPCSVYVRTRCTYCVASTYCTTISHGPPAARVGRACGSPRANPSISPEPISAQGMKAM
ncbi:hypothetical protein Mapa_001406 [Marchantia paleacea]|nr:hypothetical protein Mapa_001406 [Marchantia paleacea]